MSSFSAKITVDAKEKSNAIYDSISIDNEFYPENPAKTKIMIDEITRFHLNLNN